MRNRLIIGVVLLALTMAGTARADVRLAYVDIPVSYTHLTLPTICSV